MKELLIAGLRQGILAWGLVLGALTVAVAQEEKPAVPVDAAPVVSQALSEVLSAAGALAPNESVVIRPEIDGKIAAIHFQEGQHIDGGVLMFTLDDVLYKAQLAEAKANYELSKQNSERATQLLSSRAGTERARDEALAQLLVAEARVAIAEKNLSDTQIFAPFAGAVGLRQVSVGAYVTKGDDLVELSQTNPLKVTFQLPERVLRYLDVGQPVDVSVDALPGETFSGKVTVIAPTVTVAGRSLQLRAEIDNADGRLKPGLFARVNVTVSQHENALFMPETALLPRGSDHFVFRVRDGVAEETKVDIGTRRSGLVQVVMGLAPDDVVVIAGQMKLRNGDRVEIVGGPALEMPQGTSGRGGEVDKDTTNTGADERTGATAVAPVASRS